MTSHGEPDAPVGRLLYKGAEADVIKGLWRRLPAVYKVRKPLPYRLSSLDAALRRHRTLREAEIISSSRKAGVPAPRLYYVDIDRTTIVMEYIDGPRLKDLVSSERTAQAAPLFRELGRDAGQLHSSGITHGDLTTANMIVRGAGLVFIDFGLASHSERLEDHAVDLRLIKETLAGAHPAVAAAAMANVLAGYSQEVGVRRAAQVVGQLRRIERRGRYARLG